MSALINCVELKESADNCAAMASLAVHPPPTARSVDERVFGGHRGKPKELLPGVVGDLSSHRCLAPEFLARLLIRCTRSFAHQLEADRPDGDGEEGLASPTPARMQQPGRRTTDRSDSRDGAGSSTALAAAPTAAPAISPAPVTGQGGDNGEQLMSHAEGTDLVLGGHCALLLGLLVREQEENRCGSGRGRSSKMNNLQSFLGVLKPTCVFMLDFVQACRLVCQLLADHRTARAGVLVQMAHPFKKILAVIERMSAT